jgi:hypothetical protein
LITPNSEADKPVGEGLAEVGTSPLARRVAKDEEECLRGGEGIADAALDIRGIFVGVSFGRPETMLRDEFEGSLCSFMIVPTEGEPAIVGN